MKPSELITYYSFGISRIYKQIPLVQEHVKVCSKLFFMALLAAGDHRVYTQHRADPAHQDQTKEVGLHWL